MFTASIAYLIGYAIQHGYDIALDEGKDTKTEKDPTSDHMPGSLHDIGLAQDLILYSKTKGYLRRTEEYTLLGEEWERYGVEHSYPLTWGGRFQDGNHFSWSWGGKK